MITLLFLIMMAAVFGKLFLIAVKAAWGITKILLCLILLPLTIAGLFFCGMMQIAFPILAIIGLISLLN